ARVGPREARAGGPPAALLQRRRVAHIAGLLQATPPRPGQRRAGAPEPRRQYAVEHVDPALDHLEHALWIADAHEVARTVARQQRGSPPDRLEHQIAVLADRQTAQRVAIEVEARELLDRARTRLDVAA